MTYQYDDATLDLYIERITQINATGSPVVLDSDLFEAILKRLNARNDFKEVETDTNSKLRPFGVPTRPNSA